MIKSILKFISVTLLLVLLLSSCTKVWHTAQFDYTSNRLDSTAVYENEIKQMIQPYKVKLDAEMNKVIATCPEDMPKRRPESRLGNWMSDALYDKASELSDVPIDFAMQNTGGIRIPMLKKGDITKGKIFELMPFDNSLVVVHIDKELLMTFMDRIARSNGWPVSKGFYMQIKDNKVIDIKINGEALTDRIYNVALPDYIVLLRDMFVNTATKDKVIESTIEGRIVN